MKKLFFGLTVLFLGTAVAYSQTEQGNFMVGGSTNFNLDHDNMGSSNSLTTNFSVTPNVGYFIFNNFAVGLNPSLSLNRHRYDGQVNYKNTSFGVGIFTRYYLGINEKLKVPFELSFDHNWYNSEFSGFAPSNGTYFTLSPGVGISYFITKNVAVEGMINYNLYKYNSNDIDGNLNFNIGFQIFLGRE